MNLYDILKPYEQEPFLNSVPRFVVNNVAEFFYNHEKEFWKLEDFPYPRPPFDKLWFEYYMPKKFSVRVAEGLNKEALAIAEQCRIYFSGIVIKNNDPSEYGEWSIIGAQMIFKDEKPIRVGKQISFNFTIEPDGIVKKGLLKGDAEEHEHMMDLATAFYPVLMAFSFANCRNVEIITVDAPVALNKARIKKGKNPLTNYHLIKILPFGTVFQKKHTKIALGEDGKLDIVIRRGSFARYGPKHNRGLLFGKYEGIFWRPAINLNPNQTYEVKIGEPKKGS